MSAGATDTSVLARAEAEAAGPRRLGAAAVLGALLVLLLLCALILVAARPWTTELDPQAELAALVLVDELPFGLEPAEALRLPGGERVLRLARAGVVEMPRKPAPRPDAASQESPRVDWSKLPLGPAGEPPLEVFLIARAGGGRAALDAAVRRIAWKDLREVGGEGGRVPLEKGELDWHGWEVDWVIERELEPGETFRDWARLDLTTGDEEVPSRAAPSLLCLARWARGLPASKARLEELVAALAPLAPPRTEGAR